MLRDSASFAETWKQLHHGKEAPHMLQALLSTIEQKLGVTCSYDLERFPLANPELEPIFAIAARMRKMGSLVFFHPVAPMVDEPRISSWLARYRENEESRAMGSAIDNDVLALTIALAEAQERHIWFQKNDYYRNTTVSPLRSMRKHAILAPERYAGFSETQREKNVNLQITEDSVFKWIRGYSHVQGAPVYIPARTVSRHPDAHTPGEPLIRRTITTGLATYPEKTEALLRGAMEIVERDAYMITWLNQLTLPRVDTSDLASRSPELQSLMATCARFRITVHIVRMLTDAPAHAVMAVLEDETGHAPHLSIGLKTHRNLASAAHGAIMEGLRVRRGNRNRLLKPKQEPRPTTIGHYDRLDYWLEGDNFKKLRFLIAGPLEKQPEAPWENDTPAEHWQRTVTWCKEKSYECASVSLTPSKANVTPWHIEMVILPELQPIHYNENLPHIGGTRLREVPTQFGYTAREPFLDEPHPFA